MDRRFLRWGLLYLCGCAVWAGDAASIVIPSVSSNLIIDGKLDDAFWRNAQVLALSSPASIVAGGETRVAMRGNYLCFSARLPEPDRVVAHSTGRNPNWWSEDVVTWNIHVHDNQARRNLNLSLTINALGANRLEGASGVKWLEGDDKVLATSRVAGGEWTVEAAIMLGDLEQIGFLDFQRVRAPRPDAPELRWYWPAKNERATFQFAARSNDAAPEQASIPIAETRATPAPVELAWVPKNAWTEEQRTRLQTSSMLANSLHRRMSAVAEQEKQAWKRVDSRETWERFRDERLNALREWIGMMPERTPLRAEVTRRLQLGNGFVIENVVYESRPGLLVTANLYLPEKFSGRIPAIVVVHSHHAPKTQSELQDLGMTWARAGTAVLIPDQLCAGERLQSQPWPRESYFGRYALGSQLLLAGESLMKWMVWDLMRSVDLLRERPEIDPDRIVMLGAVAGGGDPAAVTAALDPRIAAVIPFNFGEAGPEEHYTDGPRAYDFETAAPGWGEWETTRTLPHSAAGQFFPWLLCASVAPRPFLYSFEIDWPTDVDHEPAWARYKKVFELYGARDHLDEVHGFGPFPGPGECTNVGVLLRKRMYPILHRWLGIPEPVAEFHEPLPESTLACLTPATAMKRQPKSAVSVALGIARQSLDSSRSRRLTLAGLREALQTKLGNIDPLPNPPVTRLWAKTVAPVTVEALTIEIEPGIVLPVYILKPEHPASERIPVVLAVAQGGKAQFLSEREGEILQLLRNGIAVCLPDLRGTGELAATSSRMPGAMDPAVTELMLGETLPGAQLRDVRTVFQYLRSRPDLDADRIALWGDSFAPTNPDDFVFDQSEMQQAGPFPQHQAEPLGPLLVLLSGLYEDSVTAIAARGGLASFLSVLEDRFSHIPEDVVVPGLLKVADISDIVAAQAPRPVLLEKYVDGRNRVDHHPDLRTAPGLIVRDAPATPELAAWLSAECSRKKPQRIITGIRLTSRR
jgi:dienelactone hydrolase